MEGLAAGAEGLIEGADILGAGEDILGAEDPPLKPPPVETEMV
jgi:hypothetical protein